MQRFEIIYSNLTHSRGQQTLYVSTESILTVRLIGTIVAENKTK